jgi:hypothetical protein
VLAIFTDVGERSENQAHICQCGQATAPSSVNQAAWIAFFNLALETASQETGS